jgi:hypothetical protein
MRAPVRKVAASAPSPDWLGPAASHATDSEAGLKSPFLFPLRAKPRLASLGSSRLGLLIHDGLGNLRECLVRRFLFPQRRLQELDGIRQA